MEAILQTDILNHYLMKLSETIEDFDSCKLQVNALEELIADGWNGDSAIAAKEKLDASRLTIDGMSNLIQEARQILSALMLHDP